MVSYHNPAGTAMDISAGQCPTGVHAHLYVDETSPRVFRMGSAFFVVPPDLPPDPPSPRTAAAGRTRSPRWRAGTRRTRRLSRRPGPRPAPADPFAGWDELGWVTD